MNKPIYRIYYNQQEDSYYIQKKAWLLWKDIRFAVKNNVDLKIVGFHTYKRALAVLTTILDNSAFIRQSVIYKAGVAYGEGDYVLHEIEEIGTKLFPNLFSKE